MLGNLKKKIRRSGPIRRIFCARAASERRAGEGGAEFVVGEDAECAGLQIAEREVAVGDAFEAGDFVAERFAEAADLAVFPLLQRQHEMRFAPARLAHEYARGAQGLVIIHNARAHFVGVGLRHFSAHGDGVDARHGVRWLGQPVREPRIVRQQQQAGRREVETAHAMERVQRGREQRINRRPVLLVLGAGDDAARFVEHDDRARRARQRPALLTDFRRETHHALWLATHRAAHGNLSLRNQLLRRRARNPGELAHRQIERRCGIGGLTKHGAYFANSHLLSIWS